MNALLVASATLVEKEIAIFGEHWDGLQAWHSFVSAVVVARYTIEIRASRVFSFKSGLQVVHNVHRPSSLAVFVDFRISISRP